MDVQNSIMYTEWKQGRTILVTFQLYQALEHANIYRKDDIYWILQEIAKRNVSGNPHFEHL